MNLPLQIYRVLRAALPAPVVEKIQHKYQAVVGLLKYGDADFPRQIGIEISTHCNRRCYYCPQSVEPAALRFITDAMYAKILFRLAELRWDGPISFAIYNEPLLVADLEEKVRWLMRVCPKALPQVVSNGDMLTEKRVRSLLSAGVCSFYLTRHPPFHTEWDERIGRLAAQFPARVFWHSIEDWELQTRGGLVSPKKTVSARINREGCRLPYNTIPITIDGDYMWCCNDWQRSLLMGNVRDTSIRDAWFSEPWATLRRDVLNRKPTLGLCKKCFERMPSGVCQKCKGTGVLKRGLFSRRFKPCSCTQ